MRFMTREQVIDKELGEHICQRRRDNFGIGMVHLKEGTKDHWYIDKGCTYCGSLHPDIFMQRLEAGDVDLTPTDKSYKVYLDNAGGAPFHNVFRNCPRDEHYQSDCTGPDDCPHYVNEETEHSKFYFQHLSEEQRTRFIELYNNKQIKMKHPGYFYVLPFFTQSIGAKR